MVKPVVMKRSISHHSGIRTIIILIIGTIVILLYSTSGWNQQEPMNTNSFQESRVVDSTRQNSEPHSSSSRKEGTIHGSTHTPFAQSHSETKNTTSSYPLQDIGIRTSAKEAYERGFRQALEPVATERWDAVSNTTCLPHKKQKAISDWKRRVPHVIMIGSQKGGTTALSYYLYAHPSISYFPPKELNFFDRELDQNPTLITNSGIDATRLLNYYQRKTIGDIVSLEEFQSEIKYALDATPNYLFLSDRVPQRILCITPWVKLLAVLRDPVDRAFSQYHMQRQHDCSHPQKRRGSVSFEEYISLDMKVLQETGVLPKGYGGWHTESQLTIDDFDVSILLTEEVTHAWSTYTKLGVNSPVGRGLYSLQLSQWFRAMDSYGKLRSDLLVLPSDRLLNTPESTYSEIINFLDLSPYSLEEYGAMHKTNYDNAQMDPKFRAKLHAFFLPFNRQLKDLLSTNDWDGIWDENA